MDVNLITDKFLQFYHLSFDHLNENIPHSLFCERLLFFFQGAEVLGEWCTFNQLHYDIQPVTWYTNAFWVKTTDWHSDNMIII